MKDWRTIEKLKRKIEDYEHPNTEFQSGVVLGLFYALNLLEHGEEYTDQKVKMPKSDCGCDEGRDGGC